MTFRIVPISLYLLINNYQSYLIRNILRLSLNLQTEIDSIRLRNEVVTFILIILHFFYVYFNLPPSFVILNK